MSETLIVIVLDESGSMHPKMADVLGGYNSFIENQKRITCDQARVYLVKFNSTVTVVFKGKELKDVPALTHNNYFPNGATALYDAIAEGVRIANKDKRKEERVVCVIMTDGQENSSRKTTRELVRQMITGYEGKGDWTFIYIGENPFQWAMETGMSPMNGMAYNHITPLLNFEILDSAVSDFRESVSESSKDVFSGYR